MAISSYPFQGKKKNLSKKEFEKVINFIANELISNQLDSFIVASNDNYSVSVTSGFYPNIAAALVKCCDENKDVKRLLQVVVSSKDEIDKTRRENMSDNEWANYQIDEYLRKKKEREEGSPLAFIKNQLVVVSTDKGPMLTIAESVNPDGSVNDCVGRSFSKYKIYLTEKDLADE